MPAGELCHLTIVALLVCGVGGTFQDEVLVKGAPRGTSLIECPPYDVGPFTALTFLKGDQDCQLCKVTLGDGDSDLNCPESVKEMFNVVNGDNHKYNLTAKKVIDFSFADKYTCSLTPREDNREFRSINEGSSDDVFIKSVSVTDHVQCPGPMTIPTKTNMSLNFTIRHRGPARPIMKVNGKLADTVKVLDEDDFGVVTRQGSTHIYHTSESMTMYKCVVVFEDPSFDKLPPCIVQVTSVDSGQPAVVSSIYQTTLMLVFLAVWYNMK